MTTHESNKMIATFMGLVFKKNRKGVFPPEEWSSEKEDVSYSKLFYATNWEWLMPVVEKIESLGYVSTIEKLNSEHDSHRVYFNEKGSLKEVARGARDENKFVAIYMAVEDFIDWYNKSS